MGKAGHDSEAERSSERRVANDCVETAIGSPGSTTHDGRGCPKPVTEDDTPSGGNFRK